jgi:2-polyprenyl-6-methoxyphenol hydroxylase-like FAD-dependent oxidoreductase
VVPAAETPPEHTPVLIVGGGPLGLACAVELAHHGVESLVLEHRPEVSHLRPRAKMTSARTMEDFRRFGIHSATGVLNSDAGVALRVVAARKHGGQCGRRWHPARLG